MLVMARMSTLLSLRKLSFLRMSAFGCHVLGLVRGPGVGRVLLAMRMLSGLWWRWRSKDAGEDVDAKARELEEVIVLRMSVFDALFSVSCAALGLGGCCWR